MRVFLCSLCPLFSAGSLLAAAAAVSSTSGAVSIMSVPNKTDPRLDVLPVAVTTSGRTRTRLL